MPFIIRLLIAPTLALHFFRLNKSSGFASRVTPSQVASSTRADRCDNGRISSLTALFTPIVFITEPLVTVSSRLVIQRVCLYNETVHYTNIFVV